MGVTPGEAELDQADPEGHQGAGGGERVPIEDPSPERGDRAPRDGYARDGDDQTREDELGDPHRSLVGAGALSGLEEEDVDERDQTDAVPGVERPAAPLPVDGPTATVAPSADVTPGAGNAAGIAAGMSGKYMANRG